MSRGARGDGKFSLKTEVSKQRNISKIKKKKLGQRGLLASGDGSDGGYGGNALSCLGHSSRCILYTPVCTLYIFRNFGLVWSSLVLLDQSCVSI